MFFSSRPIRTFFVCIYVPQHYRGVIAGLAVTRAPGETFLMEAEVLHQGDDRERRALIKGLFEGAVRVAGVAQRETLVVLDVAVSRLLASRQYCERNTRDLNDKYNRFSFLFSSY